MNFCPPPPFKIGKIGKKVKSYLLKPAPDKGFGRWRAV